MAEIISLKTLSDLHQEGVVGEELVRRMASKWEKVVDKAALLTLGRKLIICANSSDPVYFHMLINGKVKHGVGYWSRSLHYFRENYTREETFPEEKLRPSDLKLKTSPSFCCRLCHQRTVVQPARLVCGRHLRADCNICGMPPLRENAL